MPFSKLHPGDKVLLAFSGGVDSTVAAYLCRQAGLDVHAINLMFLPDSEESVPEIQRVADALEIPLTFRDCREDFRKDVMFACWKVFESGKTPNPCSLCNPRFKFGVLERIARENGYAALVTGHYARISTDNGIPCIVRAENRRKDQSYFLCRLTQNQIEYSCFPLGDYTKDQVREIAESAHLPNARKKDSQDTCFAPADEPMAEFLRKQFDAKVRPGSFIHLETGRILGSNMGIHAYTIGQRKGTGVALGKPAYVQRIDPIMRRVIITDNEDTLLADRLTVSDVLLLRPELAAAPFKANVQIRYRSPAAPATVCCDGGKSTVIFDNPVRAITPGQVAVFYDEGDFKILGSGIID